MFEQLRLLIKGDPRLFKFSIIKVCDNLNSNLSSISETTQTTWTLLCALCTTDPHFAFIYLYQPLTYLCESSSFTMSQERKESPSLGTLASKGQ